MSREREVLEATQVRLGLQVLEVFLGYLVYLVSLACQVFLELVGLLQKQAH